MKRVLGWVAGVCLLLLAVSTHYPQLTAQVLAHATPDISVFANWFQSHVLGTGVRGSTMGAIVALKGWGILKATAAAVIRLPDKLEEKRHKLGELVTAQRALLDVAEAEHRDLTAEERSAYEAREPEVEALDAEIRTAAEAETRRTNRLSRLTQVERNLAQFQSRPIRPGVTGGPTGDEDEIVQRGALRLYKGRAEMAPAKWRKRWDARDRAAFEARMTDQYSEAFLDYILAERAQDKQAEVARQQLREARALSVGTDAQGGYAVPVQEFIKELIMKLDDLTPLMAEATTFDVPQARSLGVPTLEAFPADGQWTTELAIGTADTAMAFGKRELNPWPIATNVLVSRKLIRNSPIDIESIVRDRLAYKLAIPIENALEQGDGNNKPLGIFTAGVAPTGIDTSRDTTISTSSAVDADKLITLRHSLRDAYRKAKWVMHRTTFAKIRALKSTTGQYLWMPGLAGGFDTYAPTLLDFPYILDENAPAFSTVGGSYVVVLGDLSYIWVARALDITVQRLDELYAATNQFGYLVRAEIDGMPVLADAFVRGAM